MRFSELVVLLPCHSLEDFPTYHEGDAAEGLLAAWSALWHPALIASAGRTPTWQRADDPPQEFARKLIVIPTAVQSELPAGYASRAKGGGALVVRKLHKRDEIVAAALAELDGGAGASAGIAAEFLALGWCYLLTELLTRRMRYVSHLDEVQFQTQALAAAQAAMSGDEAAARNALATCFEALAEVRGHYYGVDAYLLDLTLVASTTMGESLRQELSAGSPVNLLVCGSVLQQMAEREPATLVALREALERGTASIAGGEFDEAELPLLTPEEILSGLSEGLATYERILGRGPLIFGRRRFGLTPVLPQILSKVGFRGALHFTLDDGRFPPGERSKSRWEGIDGTAIDAVGRVPLDAGRADAFLTLADKMGESMDYDMVATVAFAHWPGQTSAFYDDLRRLSAYTPVIGKFVTLDHYIEHTASSGMLARFEPDDYRPPYLQQAVIRRQEDPISSSMRRVRAQTEAQARSSLQTLNGMLTAPAASGEPASMADSTQLALTSLAQALPKSTAGGSPGTLVVNPTTQTLVAAVAIDPSTKPRVIDHIKCVGHANGNNHAVVEVPAMGFAWVGDAPAVARAGKSPKPMVEDLKIRNEFCEVTISPETGTILAIHDYRTRGNRLTQQIAFRLPNARPAPGQTWRDPDDDAVYSVTAVDSVEVTSLGPPLGEITSTGRLLDLNGSRLAGFRQTTSLWFGSRIVRVAIDLDVGEEPRADPWNSYYAVRFAWPDAAADVYRDVNFGSHVTELKRIESPSFLEIRSGDSRTAILCAGLLYHRKMGMRMLDTLLVVRGETCRRFELGIVLDEANPLAAAQQLFTPPLAVRGVPAVLPDNGWMFHIDVRNVVATHWEPVIENGAAVGFRARLLETQGRSVRARLQCFRQIVSARQTDYRQNPLNLLTADGDTIEIQFGPYEWAAVEARF